MKSSKGKCARNKVLEQLSGSDAHGHTSEHVQRNAWTHLSARTEKRMDTEMHGHTSAHGHRSVGINFQLATRIDHYDCSSS